MANEEPGQATAEQPLSLDTLMSEAAAEAAQRPPETETPPAAPAQPATTPETPPPLPEPEPPPFSYEYDLNGEKVKLSKEEVDYLLNVAVEAHRRAQAQQTQEQPPAPQEPKPQEQPTFKSIEDVQRFIEKEVERRTREYTDYVEQTRRETTMNQMLQDAQGAITKDDTLAKVAADEESKRILTAFVLHAKGVNPGMSWDTAARTISKLFSASAAKEKQQYIEAKIQQAAARIDGPGGTAPAPGAKVQKASDLWDGSIVEETKQRLLQAEH